MKIDFVDYKPVIEEKYLGVATVTVDDKFTFRYKVFPGKEGKGVYFLAPSLKVKEDYVSGFEFDSKKLESAVVNVIRDNVRQYLGSGRETETPHTSPIDETEVLF